MALLVVVKLSKHMCICKAETSDDKLNVTKASMFV